MILKIVVCLIFGISLAYCQEIEPRQKVKPRQYSGCASVPDFMDSDRIVGGATASSPIPWQVSVRQGMGGSGHFCGGTILDAKTIMCAAHCFTQAGYPQDMTGYYIMAGAVNKYDSSQTIPISIGVWNSEKPYVDNPRFENDFVILKLESALTFNHKVQPACLPDEPTYSPEDSGKKCFVSGWGRIQENGASPEYLQWVDLPLITNSQCAERFKTLLDITNSMICAGYPEGAKDACQGDSGGPLVCNEGGKAVLTGVVSFGVGCARPNFPGIYARVSSVLNWIKSNMEPGTNDGCGSPNFANDSHCDDENNNARCNFDGGACCNQNIAGWDDFCTDCECLNPTTTTTTTASTTTSAGCGSPNFANDNSCDDENNNAGCNFDGGACCNNNNAGWDEFCTDCECLNPTTTTTTMTTTTTTTTISTTTGGSCGSPKFANDIYCDDENNNAGCNFDGGACCNRNNSKWNNYCTECKCLEVKNCKAIGIWSSFPNMDKWCNDNCNHSPPYCPATHCSCA